MGADVIAQRVGFRQARSRAPGLNTMVFLCKQGRDGNWFPSMPWHDGLTLDGRELLVEVRRDRFGLIIDDAQLATRSGHRITVQVRADARVVDPEAFLEWFARGHVLAQGSLPASAVAAKVRELSAPRFALMVKPHERAELVTGIIGDDGWLTCLQGAVEHISSGLSVEAVNHVEFVSGDGITLDRRPPRIPVHSEWKEPMPRPDAGIAVTGDTRWACFVGAERYSAGSGFAKLSSGQSDARSLAEFFRTRAGFQTTVVLAGAGTDGNADKRELIDHLRRLRGPIDLAVIGISAHGEEDSDGEFRLALEDARTGDPSSHLSLRELLDLLDQAQVRTAVLIFDSCWRISLTQVKVRTQAVPKRREGTTVCLHACARGEDAQEYTKNGAFTAKLLEALWKQSDDGGEISLHSAFDKAKNTITKILRQQPLYRNDDVAHPNSDVIITPLRQMTDFSWFHELLCQYVRAGYELSDQSDPASEYAKRFREVGQLIRSICSVIPEMLDPLPIHTMPTDIGGGNPSGSDLLILDWLRDQFDKIPATQTVPAKLKPLLDQTSEDFSLDALLKALRRRTLGDLEKPLLCWLQREFATLSDENAACIARQHAAVLLSDALLHGTVGSRPRRPSGHADAQGLRKAAASLAWMTVPPVAVQGEADPWQTLAHRSPDCMTIIAPFLARLRHLHETEPRRDCCEEEP